MAFEELSTDLLSEFFFNRRDAKSAEEINKKLCVLCAFAVKN